MLCFLQGELKTFEIINQHRVIVVALIGLLCQALEFSFEVIDKDFLNLVLSILIHLGILWCILHWPFRSWKSVNYTFKFNFAHIGLARHQFVFHWVLPIESKVLFPPKKLYDIDCCTQFWKNTSVYWQFLLSDKIET